ncbi:MAG TPA: hypothetical protein VFA40_20970, partial [Terriglobales bacterium]|nr:hypothetical protein [Terriglobales bacterium]
KFPRQDVSGRDVCLLLPGNFADRQSKRMNNRSGWIVIKRRASSPVDRAMPVLTLLPTIQGR